jgi:hypothetical protein
MTHFFKMWQVVHLQIAVIDLSIEGVAIGLRAAVHRKMLGGGHQFEVPRVIALQAAHEHSAQFTGQKRILAVGLLTAPPARIAKKIDIRRPEGQALIDLAFPLAQKVVMLGARLIANRLRDAMVMADIPGCRKANGLGKDRGLAGAGDAVQAFVPPVISRHPKPRNRWSIKHHLRHLFRQRQTRDQVVHRSSTDKSGS